MVSKTNTYTNSVTGAINNPMNKKQLIDYIISHLDHNGKAYKKSSERLAYDLGFTIALLAEVCEHDIARTAFVKKKLTKLKNLKEN